MPQWNAVQINFLTESRINRRSIVSDVWSFKNTISHRLMLRSQWQKSNTSGMLYLQEQSNQKQKQLEIGVWQKNTRQNKIYVFDLEIKKF